MEPDDAQEKQILELRIWFLGRTMPRMKVENQILELGIWFLGRAMLRMKLQKQILEPRIWFWSRTMPKKRKSWGPGFGFGPDDAQDENWETNPGA